MIDDLDRLLSDVRKTINDNKLFLDKLVNEAVEIESEEDCAVTGAVVEEDFEEL